MRNRARWMAAAVICVFVVTTLGAAQNGRTYTRRISWRQCLNQEPEFYSSDEAIRVADNVLLYQRNTGGWPSNINMARELTEEQKNEIREDKEKQDSLLDNSATHTQIRYLAKVYHATKLERFRQPILDGLDYLLEAQYDNGGWPQIYPSPSGYHKLITFNDEAVIGAISVLREVAENEPEYAFVDQHRHKKAAAAVQKGIECILKCQIVVEGRLTAWCQQHDENTFEPRPARTFEPAAVSARESVGIVKFLMSIDDPNAQIIKAVQSAVAWFESVKLTGIRQRIIPSTSGERGFDKIIVKDETAKPIWAHLYEIGTNRPIFGDRDRKVYYAMSEISVERREGYSWYGYWPAKMLAEDYPAWQKKWAPKENVLDD